jgi:hypothetical protein
VDLDNFLYLSVAWEACLEGALAMAQALNPALSATVLSMGGASDF